MNPMSDRVTDLKNRIARLSKEIGTRKVCAALVDAGLSPRQSDKLSNGEHQGNFRKKTVIAMEAVLAIHEGLKAS